MGNPVPTQMRLFEVETVENSGFTSRDLTYDYEADDAEAVVYMSTQHLSTGGKPLYVMRRFESQAFCSHPKTCGKGRGGEWMFMFTTHQRNWRDRLDDFMEDDLRFMPLLILLGIVPIYGDRFGFNWKIHLEIEADRLAQKQAAS